MFKKVNLRVLIVLLISIISSLLIGKFGEKLLPTENDLNLWLGYVIGFLLGGVALFTDFGLRNPNNLK